MGPLIFSTEASVLTSRGDWRSGAALSAILLIAISSRGSSFAALRLSCQYVHLLTWPHVTHPGRRRGCSLCLQIPGSRASKLCSRLLSLEQYYLTMKVYILKWKETVLFGPKLNVRYSLFVRQTDESVLLRKVGTWLLYCVLLTAFLQSYLRSKILVQSFIPFKFRPLFHLFYQK